MDTSYAVFCGIDVGKSEHHAVGLDDCGTRLYDKALPNDETRLRAVFDHLATHGPVLIVYDSLSRDHCDGQTQAHLRLAGAVVTV